MTHIPKGAIVGFMVAILLVGLVRFSLTASGAPDEVTKYASMTAVILAGCVFFGAASRSWRELLLVSYLLVLPYMAVELGGIGYTWSTGKTTIFHAPRYSFGLDVGLHFWGHLLGGLTWEPLSLFAVMLVVRTMAKRLRARDRREPEPDGPSGRGHDRGDCPSGGSGAAGQA